MIKPEFFLEKAAMANQERTRGSRTSEASQASDAAQWLSRTIAIVVFMVGPGYLGNLLDRKLETQLWTPVGFAAGMALSTTLFIIMSKKMIPKAGGQAITDEEWQASESDPAGEDNGDEVLDPDK